jgi:hypothetical protein
MWFREHSREIGVMALQPGCFAPEYLFSDSHLSNVILQHMKSGTTGGHFKYVVVFVGIIISVLADTYRLDRAHFWSPCCSMSNYP